MDSTFLIIYLGILMTTLTHSSSRQRAWLAASLMLCVGLLLPAEAAAQRIPFGASVAYGYCFGSEDPSSLCETVSVTVRYNPPPARSGMRGVRGKRSSGFQSFAPFAAVSPENAGGRFQVTASLAGEDHWDPCCKGGLPDEDDPSAAPDGRRPQIASERAGGDGIVSQIQAVQPTRVDVGENLTVTAEAVARLSVSENLGRDRERFFLEPYVGAGLVFVSEGEVSSDRPEVAAIQEFTAPALTYGLGAILNLTDAVGLQIMYRGYVYFPDNLEYRIYNTDLQAVQEVTEVVRTVSIANLQVGLAFNF